MIDATHPAQRNEPSGGSSPWPPIKRWRKQSPAIEAARDVLTSWGMRIDRDNEDAFLRHLQQAFLTPPKKRR